MSSNPLLEKSPHPFEAPAFDKIKEEHYLPAVKAAIEEAENNIQAIKDNPDPPDFENTIIALELAFDKLGTVLGIFGNQFSAARTDGLMKLMAEIPPLQSAFSNEVSQDADLFARIKAVYDQKDKLDLNTEQQTVLEDTYKGFVRGGALLDADKQARFKEISAELSVLGPTFQNNVMKSSESFELILENQEDLSGLPQDDIKAARKRAIEKAKKEAQKAANKKIEEIKQKLEEDENPDFSTELVELSQTFNDAINKFADEVMEEKWLFTLDAPVFFPFMEHIDNRDLREKMWRAFNNRAFQDDYDNCDNILKITKLRDEKAKLLGYKNHADLILSEHMAKSPDNVFNFLEKLRSNYKPAAEKELESLQQFAKDNGGPEKLMPWDLYYYGEKQKQALFGFSSEELRPYFPLEQTLDGIFDHFSKLFGLEFKEIDTIPTWHEDVKTFEVIDQKTGNSIGLLYGDFFPREGKQEGAWKTSYRDQGLTADGIKKPIISIVCNFTKPTDDKPALLSFDEVTTLLHEMGHAVHALCSDVTYTSHSGTNVLRDFVELPSQLQENWGYKKETLDNFAAHYKTGEKISAELIEKLNKAKNFGIGGFGLRQVSLGTIDMKWHTTDPTNIDDVAAFEEEVTRDTRLFDPMGGPVSTAFSHIFAGGYSAGYYSYKWAEVLDADAFEAFEENGLYDPATAQSYKDNILAKGGSDKPEILYRNFRGRDADPDALLRREGLLKKKQARPIIEKIRRYLTCQMN